MSTKSGPGESARGTAAGPDLRFRGRRDAESREHQALLVVGFGGPEGRAEVLPFLERVTAGRGIPRERLAEVGAHYDLFGGVSPINAQTRALVAAVRAEVTRRGLDLAVYWGNRNAEPFVEDAVAAMARDGITRAAFFATSSFASYSGCRQYREDVARACATVDDPPSFDKLRLHHNHPGFIEPMADRVRAALAGVPGHRRSDAAIVFTAHSIPTAMAMTCDYEVQLRDCAALVLAAAGLGEHPVDLAWQSRSGPPEVPWLEPDVGDRMTQLRDAGMADAVVVPLGFVSDHVEVLYDLDVELRALAGELGVHLVRAQTVGADPRFVRMVVDLALERRTGVVAATALGSLGVPHDVCLATCCPNLRQPDTPAVAQAPPTT